MVGARASDSRRKHDTHVKGFKDTPHRKGCQANLARARLSTNSAHGPTNENVSYEESCATSMCTCQEERGKREREREPIEEEEEEREGRIVRRTIARTTRRGGAGRQ